MQCNNINMGIWLALYSALIVGALRVNGFVNALLAGALMVSALTLAHT